MTARTCTWEGCTRAGKHELVSADQGDVYGDLCAEHLREFEGVVRAATIGGCRDPRLVEVWIKAQGGRANAERRRLKRAFHVKVHA